MECPIQLDYIIDASISRWFITLRRHHINSCVDARATAVAATAAVVPPFPVKNIKIFDKKGREYPHLFSGRRSN